MRVNRSARFDYEKRLRFVPRAFTRLYSIWISATYPFASLGRKVSFDYRCDLQNTPLIEIGDFVSIHKDAWVHASLYAEGKDKPVLIIGNRCFIGRRSHISAKNHIHIGDGVLLAAAVLIEDHGHAYNSLTLPIRDQGVTEGGRIRIGEGCWIGQGAAIICNKGELVLGRNSVVGVNAVVTRSCPPYSVLSGNPARVVKHFDPAKGEWVLGSPSLTETGDAQRHFAPTNAARP
jgi:acetyltransferase-like isoleucine patch superfamily enzyme